MQRPKVEGCQLHKRINVICCCQRAWGKPWQSRNGQHLDICSSAVITRSQEGFSQMYNHPCRGPLRGGPLRRGPSLTALVVLRCFSTYS